MALDSQHGGNITVYFRYGKGSFTCKTVLTCRIDKATGAFAGCAGHYVAMMGGWATLVANGNPHVLRYNRRDRRSRVCAPQAQGERTRPTSGSWAPGISSNLLRAQTSSARHHRSKSATDRAVQTRALVASQRQNRAGPRGFLHQGAPRDEQADGAVRAAPASITPQLPWGAVLSGRPAGRPASLRSRRRNRPASRRAAHH